MKLSDLLWADSIVVQCHNAPDADAVSSGWGAYLYFAEKNKNVRFIYGGKESISKKNLQLMVEKLDIPIEHIEQLEEKPDLLLTVDCRHGESNVQSFEAKNYAAIDHHKINNKDVLSKFTAYEIKENYGACATLIWNMLCAEEDFAPKKNIKLATALYYGLFMDTCKLQEIYRLEDRIARNELEKMFDENIMKTLMTHNLSLDELGIVARALEKVTYNEKYRFAIAQAEECDPNILGIISDQLNEVDGVDTCVIFSVLPDGVKLSVRSCIGHINANEIASYLAGGGGHKQKAGGWLKFDTLKEKAGICTPSGEDVTKYISDMLESYISQMDIIYAGERCGIDFSSAPLYQKLPIEIGFVDLMEIYKPGDKVRLMTLEGDVDIAVDDMYLMIGIDKEVYSNDSKYFESHNDICEDAPAYTEEELEKIDKCVFGINTDSASLKGHIRKCLPKATSRIRALPITRRTKIHSKGDKWFDGDPGDYIAMREEDPSDIYIIRKHIFVKTYAEV